MVAQKGALPRMKRFVIVDTPRLRRTRTHTAKKFDANLPLPANRKHVSHRYVATSTRVRCPASAEHEHLRGPASTPLRWW